ncbi:segment polarity protein dishevelled [Hydra vulgaris]|uniref:Segment polarity protein dishevelled n=1 Tax=Hydra vulgaris TaxID=6087 RepID=A0ABM4BC88_HYDVU
MTASENNSIVDGRRAVHKALSKLAPIPETVLLSFEIRKLSSESLGITIIGGVNAKAKFIYVKSVDKNGLCYKYNTLEIGDQILMVNEHNFRNVTHEEAVRVLRESGTCVKIMVSRIVDKKRKYDLDGLQITQDACVFSNTLSAEEPAVLENKQIWGKIA